MCEITDACQEQMMHYISADAHYVCNEQHMSRHEGGFSNRYPRKWSRAMRNIFALAKFT